MEVFKYIEQFTRDQDVAENSRKLYVRNIKSFVRWCQAQNKDIYQLGKSDIIEYKQWMFAQKYSTLTIDNYLTSVRKFYQWLDYNDYYNDITIGVKNPKKYMGYKKDPLTVEQVNSVLTSIDRTTVKGKRDYAIINLMLRTGIRTVEVVRLTMGDIELTKGNYYLNIIRKGSQGNKSKIAITDKAFDPINDYLVERNNLSDYAPLFCVISYNHRNLQLTSHGLSQLLKQRLRAVGINSKRITAHSFRHTAAMNALKAGASLHEVQLFLGHTSPNTTQLYIRAIEEEKRLANTPGKLLDKVY